MTERASVARGGAALAASRPDAARGFADRYLAGPDTPAALAHELRALVRA